MVDFKKMVGNFRDVGKSSGRRSRQEARGRRKMRDVS